MGSKHLHQDLPEQFQAPSQTLVLASAAMLRFADCSTELSDDLAHSKDVSQASERKRNLH
jgi:hypothetical protein